MRAINPLYYKTQFKKTVNVEIFPIPEKYTNHGAGEEIIQCHQKN